MLGQALSGLGPIGGLTFLGGIGVGCWLAVKLSQKVIRAYYFALFTLLGALLTLVVSFVRSGEPPHPAAWIAASLAFGWMAVAIRAKIVRAISIGALLLASYWFVGQRKLPGTTPEGQKPHIGRPGKSKGTSKSGGTSI